MKSAHTLSKNWFAIVHYSEAPKKWIKQNAIRDNFHSIELFNALSSIELFNLIRRAAQKNQCQHQIIDIIFKNKTHKIHVPKSWWELEIKLEFYQIWLKCVSRAHVNMHCSWIWSALSHDSNSKLKHMHIIMANWIEQIDCVTIFGVIGLRKFSNIF